MVFDANKAEMISHNTVNIVVTCHGINMNIEAIATEGMTETMLMSFGLEDETPAINLPKRTVQLNTGRPT